MQYVIKRDLIILIILSQKVKETLSMEILVVFFV